jgi:CBS domain-containing protein
MSIEKSVKAVEVVALEMDDPVVLDETTPVKDVVRRMREAQYGCALISRSGKLCGIFTERDVLNKVIGVDNVLDLPVSRLMTPDPVSVHENDPIRKAAFAMHRGGFRNVPVVDSEGRVVSCVRHKDIVHFLVEYFAQHVLNLPPDPAKMPSTPEGG